MLSQFHYCIMKNINAQKQETTIIAITFDSPAIYLGHIFPFA